MKKRFLVQRERRRSEARDDEKGPYAPYDQHNDPGSLACSECEREGWGPQNEMQDCNDDDWFDDKSTRSFNSFKWVLCFALDVYRLRLHELPSRS